ncbi:hypothetical protein GYMLUDRAFT_247024 [Collybiopsis luxurians FD-317 M1]|uniref:EF-hand domain-containing protein n=1 Tax=Collybiopsis luxurians FD-317 M1 TaxID=944289 RepID=A0A0D0B2J7_9AGAR|nr:hypothetical protein GYMLUDRAFT_247024 [Collybiopsis luxurians FD-317 M1]
MSSTAFQIPQRPYANGGRIKGSASMDSFVDFDMNSDEQRPPNHRKGFSSPLALFRHRKKSTGDTREKPPPPPTSSSRQLYSVRSAESFNYDHDSSVRTSHPRALPPLPRSEPNTASVPNSNSSSPGPQGTYAPLRLSPEASVTEFGINDMKPSWQPQVKPRYDGLPYNQQQPLPPLHANHGSPVQYPAPPPPPQQPEGAIDAALQREGQAVLDESRMLDRDVAPDLFAAEGLSLVVTQKHHKQSVDNIKKMALGGALHLKEAEEALGAFTSSEFFTEGKDIAETLLEPAKDMIEILDGLTPYLPMLIVAKAAFVLIVSKEMDRKTNKQNLQLGLLTITKFWYTLCDVNVIFNINEKSKNYQDFKELVDTVVAKMKEFGNFQRLYYKHGHIAQSMRATKYKAEIQVFLDAFKDFKDQLQQILTRFSALTINNVDRKADAMDQKLNTVIEILLRQQSPVEQRIQARIEAYGGEEKAFQNSHFLNEVSESEFGVKASPELKSILREDLKSQLSANEAMFKLQFEQTERELKHAIGQSTEAIFEKLDSGPHELIQDKDIQQIWKDMVSPKKWRLSCKTRHFVDALHHYYAEKFSEHRKKRGEPHPDQWTLKFIGRVIFQPTVGDAIDSDGSGYVSIDEVNRFTAHLPRDSENGRTWSIPVFLAHAAAGWYLNSLHYREQCMDFLRKIEQNAKQMLPPNRKHLRPYFQNSCLPEIWYIVDSLNTNTFKYQQEDLRSEFEILARYRQSIMKDLHNHLQNNLSNVKFRLQGPEEVKAVMGTSRYEALVLPLLTIILERHSRIIETAHNLVLSEREFHDMTICLQSVASAFAKRYSVLTEGWRQQRFDVPLQVSSFSYGIFVNWHTHFQSTTYDEEYPELHMEYTHEAGTSSQSESRGPGPAKDLLTYPLPVQPSADELWRLRSSIRTRNIKRDDAKARERYGNLVQRVKSKRLNRLSMNVPKSPSIKSPTIRIDGDSHRLFEASAPSPTHHKPRPNSSLSTYQFEFDDPDGVLRSINDGYASGDSSELPDITYTKGKILTLDDRIRSVEEELNSMKNMLAQLLALSKQQGQ